MPASIPPATRHLLLRWLGPVLGGVALSLILLGFSFLFTHKEVINPFIGEVEYREPSKVNEAWHRS